MSVIRAFSIIAVVFGGMTVISGSAVLFTGDAINKSAGNYVAFVVWFNLVSGFGYIVTGIGLWAEKKWSIAFSIVISLGIIVIFLVFGIYVLKGGAFELRTFYALTLRLLLWLTISIVSFKKLILK